MGKGTNTTTTSSAPNPTAMAAYQNILGQAQGVAATPYTPYNGELVAPVNQQQQTGIANINANWNYAQPYLQTAAGYAQNAATPLTTAQIQQYMSPYTQDVVNATQAQFANQNEQQRQQSIGSAISQGALGGNRQGIAEAELANQQQVAQAPVISGLYNQAYTTGLNTALTEQQARAQGAYSLGNLGVSGQNAALTGANAQVGVGTLQQGTQQQQDAARYQQFINQLAYPFQTTQWLAGIGTGVGSQMGGTGTTTAPAPNPLSQWLGLGTAGLGAAGQAGLFSGLGGAAGGSGAAAAAGMGTAADSAALLAELGPMAMIARGGVVAPRSQTMPESPRTLKLQQRQLQAGHRRVQMFPHGTPELPMPRGMMRTKNVNGTFHYNPSRIDENEIHRLSTAGRENEMLDLGPYSKDDIAKRMRGGEVPVAVVERHPDGTEARAAVGTHATADRQMAAMNRTKSPGHIVRIEDPRETIGHRMRAHGGCVPGFADGGATPMGEAPPTNGVGAVLAGQPYGGGHGWIPRMDMARGAGAPRGSAGVAPPPSSTPDLAKQAKEIGSLANMIQNPQSPEPMSNYHPDQQSWPEAPEARYGGVVARARGGRASGGVANLPFHAMIPHLADGGSPYDTNYFDETFAAPIRHTHDAYDIVSNPDRLQAFGDRARENVIAENPDYVPLPRRRPEGIAPSFDLRPEITGGRSNPVDATALGYADDGTVPIGRSRAPRSNVAVVQGDQPSPLDNAAWRQGPVGAPAPGYDAMAQAEPSGAPVPAPRGVAPPSGIDLSANSKLWPSLMSAGFGAMASRSPFLGTAVGEGGLAGMQTYSNERTREDRINSEVKKLSQEAEFAQKRLDLATRPFTEQTANQKATLEQARLLHETMTPYQKAMVDHQRALEAEARSQHLTTPVTVNDPILGPRTAMRDPEGKLRFVDTGEIVGLPGQNNQPAAPPSDDAARPFKSATPSTGTMMAAQQQGLHGQAFLDAVPAPFRNTAEAVANYDAPITVFTKMGRSGVSQDKALAWVRQVNPDYDQTWYSLKGQALKNFYASSTPNSPVVQARAMNTAVGHAGDLADALQELHTANPGLLQSARESGMPMLSYLAAQAQKGVFRGTPSGAALAKIGAIEPLYSAETAKFYSGSAGSEHERQAIGAPYNPSLSFPEQIAALRTQAHMFKSKTAPLEQEYRDAFDAPGLTQYGTKQHVKEWAVAKENAQKSLAKIDQLYDASRASGSTPSVTSQPAKPKTIIQGGHTYTLQPDGSYK